MGSFYESLTSAFPVEAIVATVSISNDLLPSTIAQGWTKSGLQFEPFFVWQGSGIRGLGMRVEGSGLRVEG